MRSRWRRRRGRSQARTRQSRAARAGGRRSRGRSFSCGVRSRPTVCPPLLGGYQDSSVPAPVQSCVLRRFSLRRTKPVCQLGDVRETATGSRGPRGRCGHRSHSSAQANKWSEVGLWGCGYGFSLEKSCEAQRGGVQVLKLRCEMVGVRCLSCSGCAHCGLLCMVGWRVEKIGGYASKMQATARWGWGQVGTAAY